MWGEGMPTPGGSGSGSNIWNQHLINHPPQPPPQPNNQWSLNPTHYTNVPNNQVDWAALAQQWMVMKTSAASPGPRHGEIMHHQGMGYQQRHHHPSPTMYNNNQMQSLLPTPVATPFHHLGRARYDEGGHQQGGGDIIGEAPMDVEPLDQDNYDDRPPNWCSQNTWHQPQEPSDNPWSAALNAAAAKLNPLNANTTPQYSGEASQRKNLPHVVKQKKQNAIQKQNNFPHNETSCHEKPTNEFGGYADASGGYWSSNDNGEQSQQLSYSGGKAPSENSSDENSMSDFDAAKRKTLPIWIREGLEKMEKEKRKKEESLRLAEEREEMRKKRIEEAQAKLAAEPDQEEAATQGSKWNDGDPESRPPSDEEHSEEQAPTAAEEELEEKKGETIVDILAKLSRDEQEATIAAAIRRVSTSILINFTNDAVNQVASKTFNRAYAKRSKKATTLQFKKTSALASISGGALVLGLAVYGSDSEAEEEKSEEEAEEHDKDENESSDSEAELMSRLESKKRNWESNRVEREKEIDAICPKSFTEVLEKIFPTQTGSGVKSGEDNDSTGTSNKTHSQYREKNEVERHVVLNSTADVKPEEKQNGKSKSPSPKDKDKNRKTSLSPKRKEKRSRQSSSSESRNRTRRRSRSKSPRSRRRRSSSRSRSRSSRRRGDRRRRSKDRYRSKSKSRDHKRSSSRSRDRRRERSRSRTRRNPKSHSRSSSRSESKSKTRRKSRSSSRDRKKSNSKQSHSRSKSIDKTKNRKTKKSKSPNYSSKTEKLKEEEDGKKSRKDSLEEENTLFTKPHEKASSDKAKKRNKGHSRSRSTSSNRSSTSKKKDRDTKTKDKKSKKKKKSRSSSSSSSSSSRSKSKYSSSSRKC